MPTLPTYDLPTVERRGIPSARNESVASPGMFGAAGDTSTALGNGLLTAGTAMYGVMAEEAKRERDLADQVRVDDALNRVKESVLDLTFSKERGFVSQTGIAALDRASKQPLADEYATELDKRIGDVTTSLGSDRQRQMFGMRVNDVRSTFYGNALKHEAEQFKTYTASVDDGTIRNATNTIGLFYNDPAQVDGAIKSIEAAVARTGRLLGRSAVQIEADTRKQTSNAHMLAMTAALQKNDSAYAEAYLSKYAKQMDADDILRVQGQITKERDVQVGTGAADKVITQAAPAMQPSNMDRLANAAGGFDMARLDAAKVRAESGGRRFGADGKLLEGPPTRFGTAKGEHQVLDSTNKDPGFGIAPARDNSPEERARVGRQYLEAMVNRYGNDPVKALAAYNWGPGYVDAAIKEASKQARTSDGVSGVDRAMKEAEIFQALLPGETREYVATVLATYNSGGGAPAKPTLEDLHGQLRNDPVLKARPAALKTAIEETTRRFNESDMAVKQRDEEALAAAQRWLVNNGGSYANMPANMRNAIPPGKVDDVMTFAGKMSKGQPIETDWNKYETLRTFARGNPAAFARVDIGAAFHYLAPAQRESLIDMQDKLSKPDSAKDVATLENQLGNAHDRMGILGSGNAEKRGLFDQTVQQDISTEQRTKGKPLTFEERQKIIDRNMVKRNNGLFQFGTTRLYEARGEGKAGDFSPEVPKGERVQIEAALKRAGRQVTDEAVTDLYRRAQGLPAPAAAPPKPAGNNYGPRVDGTPKGDGWLGALKRPDGGVSTELSAQYDDVIGGKPFPLLVPTLTQGEINTLLSLKDGEKAPRKIVDKAITHAERRVKEGKSPFKGAGD